MTVQLQRAKSRLENIRRVQPILAALRTISLGSWQMARNRRAGLSAYTARLLELLAVVVPYVAEERGAHPDCSPLAARTAACTDNETESPVPQRSVVALVIGSERSLCSGYNKALARHLDSYVAVSNRAAT